jgi:hypothetical protein
VAQEADSVAVVGNTFFRVVFPLYLPGLKLSNLCVCVDRNFLLGATESRSPSRGTRERGRRIETGAAEQAQRGAEAGPTCQTGEVALLVRSKKFLLVSNFFHQQRARDLSPQARQPERRCLSRARRQRPLRSAQARAHRGVRL